MHTNVIGYTNPVVTHTYIYIIYKARGGKADLKIVIFFLLAQGEKGIKGKSAYALSLKNI